MRHPLLAALSGCSLPTGAAVSPLYWLVVLWVGLGSLACVLIRYRLKTFFEKVGAIVPRPLLKWWSYLVLIGLGPIALGVFAWDMLEPSERR